jgi:hypothetical protein
MSSPHLIELTLIIQLGRPVGSAHTPVYELQPAQYAKVKVNEWTYTGIEKKIVIKRARKAFDELELPANADERVELDKKEKEAMTIKATSSNSPPDTPNIPLPTETAKVSPVLSTGLLPGTLPSGRKISDLPPIKKYKKQPEDDSDSKPAATKSIKSVDNTKSDTVGRAIKKVKPAPKTAFGKELEKHRAGKRGTSMPNSKREGGVASPRPAAKSTLSGKSTKSTTTKSAKLSFDERMKRKAHYSDSESDSDSEDDKPTPPKKTKILSTPAPARAPAPAPAPARAPAPASAPAQAPTEQKVSPKLLSLFDPEVEAEDAAKEAAAAAAEAIAAEKAAINAKAKAEAAAAKASALAAAIKKRSAETDRPTQPYPKKARISPSLAHLGLPDRPLEDCQIVDTNPLQAEPIGRPRHGSQARTDSNSPFGNGSHAMDRTRSNSLNRMSGSESHPMNKSLENSPYSSFENLPSIETASPAALRDRFDELGQDYFMLVEQLKDVLRRCKEHDPARPRPSMEEAEKLINKYKRWHPEMESIASHFGDDAT